MYMRSRYNRRRCTCDNNCRKCEMPPVCPVNPKLANSYVPYQYIDDTLNLWNHFVMEQHFQS